MSASRLPSRRRFMVKISRDILAVAGYTESPRDTAFGFEQHTPYFSYVEANDMLRRALESHS